MKKERLFVTVIDVFGDVLEDGLEVCEINTYKWGFDFIRPDGSRVEYGDMNLKCRYSWNVNGNHVLFRITAVTE
jgi:hypothetical protein